MVKTLPQMSNQWLSTSVKLLGYEGERTELTAKGTVLLVKCREGSSMAVDWEHGISF